MIESIKTAKKELLATLKAGKTVLENQFKTASEAKYNEKKATVDAECAKLDEAFANYKNKRQSELYKEFADKQLEVDAKKTSITAVARAEAEAEVLSGFAADLNAYTEEIRKLESELAQ